MSTKCIKSTYVYTPGLQIKKDTIVRKIRKLPVKGELLVKTGDMVSYDTVLARTYVPGDPCVLRTAFELGVEPEDLNKCMVCQENGHVEKGKPIAKYSAFFGLVKKTCLSPVDGIVENISNVTGKVIIRASPVPVEVKAYIPGIVSRVFPGEGAIIETRAIFIQGIFGIGRETHGDIAVVAESPRDVLTASQITEKHEGKILIGGSLVTKDALNKAIEVGAVGIVVGGIEDKDLIDFLGYDIGVAITGHEEIHLSLVVTEGFSKMDMSSKTFGLLKELDGRHAAMCGATQIRAGVIRPEIIIPLDGTRASKKVETENDPESLASGLSLGTRVRVIRQPYLGQIGKVSNLPVGLEKVETESYVRVLEVELEDGRRVTVPRANVEIIEE